MTTHPTGAPAQTQVTRSTHLFTCGSDSKALFAVREGVGLKDALEYASTFLDSALRTTESVAISLDSAECWSASYLIEMAWAIVNSSITAIIEEENHV